MTVTAQPTPICPECALNIQSVLPMAYFTDASGFFKPFDVVCPSCHASLKAVAVKSDKEREWTRYSADKGFSTHVVKSDYDMAFVSTDSACERKSA